MYHGKNEKRRISQKHGRTRRDFWKDCTSQSSNQRGGRKMNLKTRKRISTLKQYREFEKNIKEGIKGLLFWIILMVVAGNNYLN